MPFIDIAALRSPEEVKNESTTSDAKCASQSELQLDSFETSENDFDLEPAEPLETGSVEAAVSRDEN